MKRQMALALMAFFMICTGISAQSRNHVVWQMALLKWDGSGYRSVPFQRPLDMVQDDSFQIKIQAEADCFCYVVMEDEKGVSDFVFNTPLKKGVAVILPEEDDDFVIPVPGTSGTIQINVIVSVTPVSDLAALLQQYSGGQRTATLNGAIGDRLKSLKSIAATIPAEPVETVAMAGSETRGTFTTASQFKGQEIYVRTVIINNK